MAYETTQTRDDFTAYRAGLVSDVPDSRVQYGADGRRLFRPMNWSIRFDWNPETRTWDVHGWTIHGPIVNKTSLSTSLTGRWSDYDLDRFPWLKEIINAVRPGTEPDTKTWHKVTKDLIKSRDDFLNECFGRMPECRDGDAAGEALVLDYLEDVVNGNAHTEECTCFS